jgi:alpha-N-arabinofuranosidase
MKLRKPWLLGWMFGCLPLAAQEPVTRIVLDAAQPGPVISPLLFGHNLEVTRRAIWSGLGAEMVANRKFAAAANGMAKRWSATGTGATAALDDKIPYVGKTSLRVQVAAQGDGGILQQQEILSFRQNVRYKFRWWLKTEARRSVRMRLSDSSGNQVLFESAQTLKPGEWQLWSGEFASAAEANNARLELSSSTPGAFWVGAASVQPADAFHGMRRDVIERLRQIKPGILRFPGGCYSEFYRWQDGLLPVDLRPPIGPTGLDFLLRDSDDVDTQELGIDEFMALCRELRCAPALTLRLSESTPEDAAGWVEYCNGGAQTKWGKIRASRGQSKPYAVKNWFLGNELYFFGRGGLNDPNNCAKQSKIFGEAVRKADPSIHLTGCTNLVSGHNNVGWNKPLLAEAGDLIDGISFHDYMQDSRKPGNLKEFATASTTYLWPALQKFQRELARPILFDEWNTLWGKPGSVGMGLYSAGVLNLLCREAENLAVKQALFFQPVTEGAITVTPMGAELDEAGKVFAAFSVHQGNRLLVATPAQPAEADLDLTASLSPDGKQVFVTVINRNPASAHTVDLSLNRFQVPAGSTATLLVPLALEPQSKFAQREGKLTITDGKRVSLSVPPCSVARLCLGRPAAKRND